MDMVEKCPCGERIPHGRWRRGKRDCVNCAMTRVVMHNHSMRERKGKGYDSWAKGMRAILDPKESPTKE